MAYTGLSLNNGIERVIIIIPRHGLNLSNETRLIPINRAICFMLDLENSYTIYEVAPGLRNKVSCFVPHKSVVFIIHCHLLVRQKSVS
jgi:hypothetical protein